MPTFGVLNDYMNVRDGFIFLIQYLATNRTDPFRWRRSKAADGKQEAQRSDSFHKDGPLINDLSARHVFRDSEDERWYRKTNCPEGQGPG